MKTVEVVAAVIYNDDHFFATQRGYGEFKDGWQFPGGKIKEGETPETALVREIQEELDAKIEVGPYIGKIEYDYPSFHLSMKCYWCKVVSGQLILKEHEAANWLTKETLYDIDWLPADKEILPLILSSWKV